MIFKKLTASFGVLENAHLELKEGLNIVQAPNEAGKSTWCAFLRVMLYGLKTHDRDKIGYLADKTRYRPWSGAAMAGELELHTRGQDILLRRSARGAAPMKDFSAVYAGTGETVGWLQGDTVGEALIGVPERVFERSAFIRQAGLGLDHSAELEQRISALVSTGEEGVSYAEADARLRDWQNKRYVNRSVGRIAQIDKALDGARAALRRQGEAAAELAGDKQALAALRAEQALLARELAVLQADADAKQRQERSAQAQRLERLTARVQELEVQLTREGKLLEKADAQAVRTDCAAYQALRVELATARGESEKLEQAYEEKVRAVQESPYAGKSAQEAQDAAAEQLRIYQGAALVKPYDHKKFRIGYVLLALFFALCAGAAVLFYGQTPWFPLGFALGLAALAAALVLYLSGVDKKRKRAAAEAQMEKVLQAAGASSPEALLAGAAAYAQALAELEQAKAAAEAAGAALDALVEQVRTLTSRLSRALALFQADSTDIQAALRRVDECEALMDELAALRLSQRSEQKLLDQLDALRKPQAPAAAEGPSSGPVPRYSMAETQRRLDLEGERAAELEKKLAAAQGMARAFGDPMVLGAEIARLEQARAAQSLQYEALATAIEELAAANGELRTRFSPALSRRAGEIAAALTGGRYTGLYFDRDWNTELRQGAEPVPRDALYLSAGARDQMYLALRLAICEMLLDGEEPCPIVLDDALANFDDGRMALALDFLKQTAARRQVILMTCHSREASFFSGDSSIHLARL